MSQEELSVLHLVKLAFCTQQALVLGGKSGALVIQQCGQRFGLICLQPRTISSLPLQFLNFARQAVAAACVPSIQGLGCPESVLVTPAGLLRAFDDR